MKLTRKEKFGYGFGDLSANIIVAAISFYQLYFMVSVAELNHIRTRLDLTVS